MVHVEDAQLCVAGTMASPGGKIARPGARGLPAWKQQSEQAGLCKMLLEGLSCTVNSLSRALHFTQGY